ncbi:MAG: FliI/YscN family ATPase [Gammaproteobacteria bacterium]
MIQVLDKEVIKNRLIKLKHKIAEHSSVDIAGTVTRITGMKIEAIGLIVPLGTVCSIIISSSHVVNAEVIGFSDKTIFLMATEHVDGIKPGSLVIPIQVKRYAKVGMNLLGRVIDAVGNPIDSHGSIELHESYPLNSKPINPLARKKINEPLDVGIRAINTLLTVSKGQRLGIFAGSGVGKSVLLGMMTRFTTADVVVVGLIGERGREVKEFIEEILGDNGLKKAIVVASPADTSPLMRVNGAALATSIAEYFRDKGLNVLLIIDSLTRFAQAQREISLSVGELPATKGFTPSVFAKISQLVERSGNGAHNSGSITAFYTVLIEGDDHHDPIGDHVRSVLDGHICLSRHLADAGHYPAIDIEKSISRVMTAIASDVHIAYANKFKRLYSAYAQNRDLVNVGMYQAGSDIALDEAIKCKVSMERFLKQGISECCNMQESMTQLLGLFQLEK